MGDPPAQPAGQPTSRTGRILLRLDRAAHRRWFLPAVAAFPLSDYALPVMPNQMLLMALSVLQPRRWWTLTVTFVAATSLGALLVAAAVQTAGPWLLDTVSGGSPDQGTFREITRQIERYGLWALVGLAMLPSPPRTAVLVCALVGISPWAIALAVLAGRPVPTTVLAIAGARAPRLLRRFRSVDRVLTEVESARAHPR